VILKGRWGHHGDTEVTEKREKQKEGRKGRNRKISNKELRVLKERGKH